MGAARNGCKTLPWQVRVLVDSGWVVDRDGGWITQMGWLLVVRWLVGGFVGCKTELNTSQRTHLILPLNKRTGS